MRNICRPFVLHNDFLPPDSGVHEDWDYLAFGYYDGISIGENLFKDNEFSLNLLWDYEKERLKKLEGKYSEKIIFGFRSENDSYTNAHIKDEIFWNQETEYPFIFAILLQIKEEDIEKLNYDKRCEMEIGISIPEKVQAISYLTLDNSDLILVLKCKEYQTGANIIDGFHRSEVDSVIKKCGMRLTYSFTIAGIDRKKLNQQLEKISEMQSENVNKAYVYVIEKWPGSIDNVLNKMNEQMGLKNGKKAKKESVLGCNDEVIIIENVPWGSFLKMFVDKTGVLNNSSSLYGSDIIGVTTIIAQTQKSTSVRRSISLENEGKQFPSLSVSLRKMIENFEAVDGKITTRDENLIRYLYQIINSLQKFEKTPFPDYVFLSAFLPMHLVMSLYSVERTPNIQRRFFDSFYEFIKSLNMYVQNATYTDRQFTQTLNFDIRIYSTPVKMNAFYNAFIHFLKKYLDRDNDEETEKREYEFLTCLGIADTMRVEELFKNVSDTKRMFIVNIPENQAYNPQYMLIMLSHEVGHFVGKKVRSRDVRKGAAKSILCKVIVNYFYEYLKKEIESEEFEYIQSEEYWKWLEEVFKKMLSAHIEQLSTISSYEERFQNCTREDATRNIEIHKKFNTYTHVMKTDFTDACGLIFADDESKEKLFSYLLEKDHLYWIEKGKSYDFQNQRNLKIKIDDAILSLIENSKWNERDICLNSIIDKMMYFFKECIADIIGIITLGISMDEYLRALLLNEQEQNGKLEIDGSNFWRSLMVVYCLGLKNKLWDFHQLEDYSNCTSEEEKKFKKGINDQLKLFLNKNNEIKFTDIEEGEDQILHLFKNTQILVEFEQYFLKCRDILLSWNTGDNPMQEVYKVFKDENVEKIVMEIQYYILKYRNDVKSIIEKYAQ